MGKPQPTEHDPAPHAREPELSRATLNACRARDPDAFRHFVQVHQHAVFALISRVAGRHAPVEDLAQEVFLRAYQALPAFDLDGPARVSTWLLTIAVRLALNAKKAEARRPRQAPVAGALELAELSTPETQRASRELGVAIASAAEELPDEQRAAFVLAEFHGWSMHDIAAALETSEPTVKTRLFRARAHLRKRLEDLQKEFSK